MPFADQHNAAGNQAIIVPAWYADKDPLATPLGHRRRARTDGGPLSLRGGDTAHVDADLTAVRLPQRRDRYTLVVGVGERNRPATQPIDGGSSDRGMPQETDPCTSTGYPLRSATNEGSGVKLRRHQIRHP